jgi:hypothetical protein
VATQRAAGMVVVMVEEVGMVEEVTAGEGGGAPPTSAPTALGTRGSPPPPARRNLLRNRSSRVGVVCNPDACQLILSYMPISSFEFVGLNNRPVSCG